MHPTSGPWRVKRLSSSRIRPLPSNEGSNHPSRVRLGLTDRPTRSPRRPSTELSSRQLPETPSSPLRTPRASARHRVPSSWFLTTSMVFSARQVQVCCALLPVMGFTAFLVVTSPLGVQWTRNARRSRPSPPCNDPSKFSLSSSRSPVSWGRSLHAVGGPLQRPPSIRRFQQLVGQARLTITSTSRSLSAFESVTPQDRFQRAVSCTSVGFFPLRGVLRASAVDSTVVAPRSLRSAPAPCSAEVPSAKKPTFATRWRARLPEPSTLAGGMPLCPFDRALQRREA